MQMVAFRGGQAGATTATEPGRSVGWPLYLADCRRAYGLASDRTECLRPMAQPNGHDARVWDPCYEPLFRQCLRPTTFSVMGPPRCLMGGSWSPADIFRHTSGSMSPTSSTRSRRHGRVGPAMAFDRWYPTVTALPDGRMLVTGGEIDCDDCNATIPEVYNPATNSMDIAQRCLAQNLPYYPHMFVLPDGRVLNTGSVHEPVPTRALTIQTQTWTMIDPSTPDGMGTVMYRPGKFLKTGTSTDADAAVRPSAATAYVLDMTQGSHTWTQSFANEFCPNLSYDGGLAGPGMCWSRTEGKQPTQQLWIRRCFKRKCGHLRRNNLADWPVW